MWDAGDKYLYLLMYLTNTICTYMSKFRELYFEQQIGRGRHTCENPNLEKEN